MTAPRRTRTAIRAGLALGLATVLLDISTKAWAERELGKGFDPLPGVEFVLGHNSGVAFGALDSVPGAVLVVIASCIIVLLAVAVVRGFIILPWHALALLIGGATANLFDRLGDGRVTDFIDIATWPSFNLADVAITVGLGLSLIDAVREGRTEAPARGTAP